MSYFSQMAGLAVQNFVSAAVGMAVLAAVIRGFASRGSAPLGNFWVDLTRTLLYILLPLSFVGALVLVSQGVIQTLAGSVSFTTVDRRRADAGARARPPRRSRSSSSAPTAAASSTSTRAMPFENPTQLSNFVEMLFILLIPAALTATFGRMVGSRRQGWALYAAMLAMFVAGDRRRLPGRAARLAGPARGGDRRLSADDGTHRRQPRGQGAALRDRQHRRCGRRRRPTPPTARSTPPTRPTPASAAWCRSLNMADRGGDLRRGRLGPLRDAAVRPPDGLHRRADGRPHARVPRQEDRGEGDEARRDRDDLRADARAGRRPRSRSRPSTATPSIFNPGPHGFSETLYAYTSQANNNGSAFAGYTGFVQPNAPGNAGAFGITFADLLGGLAMLLGRFVPLLAALAVAGVARRKRVAPAGPGTFRTDSPDVRRAADRRRRARRRAHLLPRLPARPARPGPHRPALLMACAET